MTAPLDDVDHAMASGTGTRATQHLDTVLDLLQRAEHEDLHSRGCRGVRLNLPCQCRCSPVSALLSGQR